MIVYLCGMPGVGKLTIARELIKQTDNSRLIDNHLLVDLAEAVCDRQQPYYINLMRDMLELVHQSLVDRAAANEVLVITDALAKGIEEDEERFEATRRLAARLNCPFVPVLIKCSQQANLARVASPERKQKKKLTAPDVLQNILSSYEIIFPDNHTNSLIIDNTDVTPELAAQKIAAHIVHCSLPEGLDRT